MRVLILLIVLLMTTNAYAESIVNTSVEEIQNAARDGMTSALTYIPYGHHEIHSGNHFFIESYDVIESGGSIIFAFKTPLGTTLTHFLPAFVANQPVTFAIYEGASVLNGLTLTPWNNNRNSTNTSGMIISRDPTIVTHGTALENGQFGLAGTNPARSGVGGSTTRESELILSDDTTYLFVITSDAAANSITYELKWYEHRNNIR